MQIKLNFPDNLDGYGIRGVTPKHLSGKPIPEKGDGLVFLELSKDDGKHPLFVVQTRLFAVEQGEYLSAELVLAVPEDPDGGESPSCEYRR